MKSTSFITRLLMLLVCLGVAVYFGYQSLRYLDDPLTTTVAYGYTVDETVETSGYVVRSEQVLEDDAGGLLRLSRSEGERVSRGGTVASVYADQASLDRQSEIDALEARIGQLEYVQSASLSYEASAKLDSQITQDLLAVRAALAVGRLDTVASRGSELRALVIKQDYTYSGGDPESQLEELRRELQDLRRQSAGSTRRITAPASGLYSAVVDGYETVLTPESVLELSPSQLSALQPDSAVTSHVGKLILGDEWYYAASLRSSEIKSIREAGDISLRFSKDVARDLDVTIQSVGWEENGRSVVVFRGKYDLAQLTLLRQQTAEVILNTMTGIRVPQESLRVVPWPAKGEDGTVTEVQTTGVYCLVGVKAVFKPVEVLYTGEGFVLVQGASTERKRVFRAGDEVIVTARDLFDGKVVG
nr:HlyD family efflux transporter periplasmic adaptor subunit [uncultured Oscillibacter sp.]